MGFMVGALSHVPSLSLEGQGTKVSHTGGQLFKWPIPNKNSDHQGLGELPRLAELRARCHRSVLGDISIAGTTPLGEYGCELSAALGTFSPC